MNYAVQIFHQLRGNKIKPLAARRLLESRFDEEMILIAGANKLLQLDYSKRADTAWAKKMLDTLGPMANFRFKFYVTPGRGGIRPSHARKNRGQVEKFRREVQRLY